MFFKEKRIAVTGAAGFIGSNLTDELLNLGAEVIGIDNLFNGNLNNLDIALKNRKFKFYKADIRDTDFLLDILKDIEIIFHQAAFVSVPQSILMPNLCNDVNVNGTLNILNIARKYDIDKVVFAASSSVYGEVPDLPKSEDMKRVPISPYGVSKLACESYMNVYQRVYGINTISLRYFNVYGPRQKDSPYSGVIAIWLGRILEDKNLIIFGDGSNTRDFTYIEDVVSANLLAAQSDVAGEIINIGAGSPISLNKLAKLILKLANKQRLQIEYADPRLGDILHSYANISKAIELLKFNPKYDQKQGLTKYFTWYKNKYKAMLDLKQN